MAKLYYTGFNGYDLCPGSDKYLPNVINFLTNVLSDGVLDVQCNLKTFIIKYTTYFEIKEVCNDGQVSTKTITHPDYPNVFVGLNDVLKCASGMKLWKTCYYNNSDKWTEVNLKPMTSDGERLWSEPGNSIVKLSCRQDNKDLIILLSNGSAWSYSQAGTLETIFIPDADEAVDVVCGFEHVLILTKCGCVLSLGTGSRGQLGNGDLNSSSIPIQVPALMGLKVTKIAAGGWHSCAVADAGDLYTWGWNNHGQLGYPFDDSKNTESIVTMSATPLFVELESLEDMDNELDIVDVACGARHTVIKLENNDIYSAGWNAYGQLGIGTSISHSSFKKLDVNFSRVSKLLCGPWSTQVIVHR